MSDPRTVVISVNRLLASPVWERWQHDQCWSCGTHTGRKIRLADSPRAPRTHLAWEMTDPFCCEECYTLWMLQSQPTSSSS